MQPLTNRRNLGLALIGASLSWLLTACEPTPHSYVQRLEVAAPTWGPIQQGDCVDQQPHRHYSARLHHSATSACSGPFKNIMGARFDTPSGCDQDVGYWQVYDSSCAAQMPNLPGPQIAAPPAIPAEGYADLHNHLLAHIAFGESVFWGASFGEPAEVLQPIPEHLRGPHQRVEALSSSRSILGVFDSHAEDGHPTYQSWPSPGLKTHQQSHVDWLYRAYQGGLRLVVLHAVNNQDMFDRGENRLPAWLTPIYRWIGSDAQPLAHRTSNDMEALEHQVRAAHQLVAWVREHRGGWLEIAQTPDQASQLIAQGKLALVLGSEVDHPFNCDLGRRCSDAHIQEGLTKLEAMGFAVLFPTHHKYTQFGDSANFQPLNTGPLRPCPAFQQDCAAVGLTKKGRFLVAEMMSRGLITDLGHAGDRPFSDTVALLEPQRYPTLMTHAASHPLRPNGTAEYTLTYAQLQKIRQLGGMSSLHSAKGEYAGVDNTGSGVPFASTDGGGGYTQAYLYLRDALDGGYADPQDLTQGGQIAFAADWNGFAGWPNGRFGDQAKPRRAHNASDLPLVQPPQLAYPLSLPSNLVPAAVGGIDKLPMMQLGNVTFDFNNRGLAQAGMSPDLIADMQLHGLSSADLDPLYRSARGFVELWRRARELTVDQDRGWLRWLAQSPTDLIEFDYLDRSRLVEVAPGLTICRMRQSKAIGYLSDNRCQLIEATSAQNKKSSLVKGEIRNANSGQCLTRGSNRRLIQTLCNDRANQQWVFATSAADGYQGFLQAPSTSQCATANNGKLTLAACENRDGITLERIGNTFRLKTSNNGCAQVSDRSLEDGTEITLTACPPAGRADFHWSFDALRDQRDYELLFSTQALDKTVVWSGREPSGYQHAITTISDVPLCRAEKTLGLLKEQRCHLISGANTSRFQQLWSSTRLLH